MDVWLEIMSSRVNKRLLTFTGTVLLSFNKARPLVFYSYFEHYIVVEDVINILYCQSKQGSVTYYK